MAAGKEVEAAKCVLAGLCEAKREKCCAAGWQTQTSAMLHTGSNVAQCRRLLLLPRIFYTLTYRCYDAQHNHSALRDVATRAHHGFIRHQRGQQRGACACVVCVLQAGARYAALSGKYNAGVMIPRC